MKEVSLEGFFAYLGLFYVAYLLFCALKAVQSYTSAWLRGSRPAMHLLTRYKRKNTAGERPWAVVTGASDGIGKAFALELASIGFNVCAIARTETKLNDLVLQIRSMQREAAYFVFDFSTSSSEAYSELFRQLDKLPISLLVNNVGGTHPWAGEMFEDISVEQEVALFNTNCMSNLRMTKYIVPRLKREKCGAIVNLSSLTAILRAVPYFSQYAATKSFVRSFSDSLAFELEPFGIDVLTVTPSFVSTALTQGKKKSPPEVNFFVARADAVARDALWALGETRWTAGDRRHELVQRIFDALPRAWLGRSIYKMVKKDADALRAADGKKEK